MYYFEHASRYFCVDATPETRFKGRLVNHSRINPNMQAKVHNFCLTDSFENEQKFTKSIFHQRFYSPNMDHSMFANVLSL